MSNSLVTATQCSLDEHVLTVGHVDYKIRVRSQRQKPLDLGLIGWCVKMNEQVVRDVQASLIDKHDPPR